MVPRNRPGEADKRQRVERVVDVSGRHACSDPEEFAACLKACGNTLKEGIVEDATNRERSAKLLGFASTKGDGEAQTVSLDDYVGRMAPGQDAIWYVKIGRAHV